MTNLHCLYAGAVLQGMICRFAEEKSYILVHLDIKKNQLTPLALHSPSSFALGSRTN